MDEQLKFPGMKNVIIEPKGLRELLALIESFM